MNENFFQKAANCIHSFDDFSPRISFGQTYWYEFILYEGDKL